MMINLLQETIDKLIEHGKSIEDVQYVTDGQYRTTWEEFAEVANQEYYNGYGGAAVELCLKIVGNSFWLERHEYDGSEWWSYKTQPVRPENKGPVSVFNDLAYAKMTSTK